MAPPTTADSGLTCSGWLLESPAIVKLQQTYDVIVVGAGHAGCEAALAQSPKTGPTSAMNLAQTSGRREANACKGSVVTMNP